MFLNKFNWFQASLLERVSALSAKQANLIRDKSISHIDNKLAFVSVIWCDTLSYPTTISFSNGNIEREYRRYT